MAEKITLLIIDDDTLAHYMMKAFLKSENYTLIFAENGQQALEKIETIVPDLVFLDVMMPGMNGFEVCQHLRANPRFAYLPVIMLTALDDLNTRSSCLEKGATDVISKPLNKKKLINLVTHLTQSDKESSE